MDYSNTNQKAIFETNIKVYLIGSSDWTGYVIKLTDYAIYRGKERKKRMIFPRLKTYSSKEKCYADFEKVFNEPDMIVKYPQTTDPYESYIFGCIEK